MDTQLDSRRRRIVSVRLNLAEWESIRSQATACQLPISSFIRLVALGASPTRHPHADRDAAIAELARLGTSLQRLLQRPWSEALRPALEHTLQDIRTKVGTL